MATASHYHGHGNFPLCSRELIESHILTCLSSLFTTHLLHSQSSLLFSSLLFSSLLFSSLLFSSLLFFSFFFFFLLFSSLLFSSLLFSSLLFSSLLFSSLLFSSLLFKVRVLWRRRATKSKPITLALLRMARSSTALATVVSASSLPWASGR
jgi:hypothetical protein